ncbi:MAG: C39 family peptidase [Eubacterium sp.]|nr:C39 family peptidase [Eubacterium sp.]
MSLFIAFKVTSDTINNDGFSEPKSASSESTLDYNEAYDKVKNYADKNDCSIDEYPESLIKLLAKAPESEQFVFEYPKEKGKSRKVNMKKYKNCDRVPLFIQWDTQWGYAPYGNGIVGLDGCGPTCLSMVAVYYLQDTKLSPDYVARFADKNGYYVDGVGSSWSLISEGGKKLGLDVQEIPLDENVVKNNLQQDRAIICSVGEGDFTAKGHFIVLTAYNNGEITVNDPNSYSNSERKWTYERLKPQIKNMWAVS